MNTPQRLTTIAGCSLVAAVCACDVSTVNIEEATPDIQQVAAENKLDPAGMSLDELNEVLNQSATEAELVADLLKSGLNYSLRLKEFRGHVETGFAAAQAIEQHADSSQDQKMTAGSQGLQLLYVGAKPTGRRLPRSYRTKWQSDWKPMRPATLPLWEKPWCWN